MANAVIPNANDKTIGSMESPTKCWFRVDCYESFRRKEENRTYTPALFLINLGSKWQNQGSAFFYSSIRDSYPENQCNYFLSSDGPFYYLLCGARRHPPSSSSCTMAAVSIVGFLAPIWIGIENTAAVLGIINFIIFRVPAVQDDIHSIMRVGVGQN